MLSVLSFFCVICSGPSLLPHYPNMENCGVTSGEPWTLKGTTPDLRTILRLSRERECECSKNKTGSNIFSFLHQFKQIVRVCVSVVCGMCRTSLRSIWSKAASFGPNCPWSDCLRARAWILTWFSARASEIRWFFMSALMSCSLMTVYHIPPINAVWLSGRLHVRVQPWRVWSPGGIQ